MTDRRALGRASPEGLRVVTCDGTALPLWDEFVCRAKSPWQSTAFAQIQVDFGNLPVFLAAEANGRLVGGAVVYVVGSQRFPWLDRLFMRAAFIPDEPAVVDDAPAVLPLLFEAIDRELARRHVVEVSWRFEMPRGVDAAQLAARGYSVTPFGVAVLELPRTEAELDACLAAPARRQVRKARKLGVQLTTTSDPERLLPLLALSFKRGGKAVRNDRYVRRVAELCDSEIVVASLGGKDLAALMWARFGEVALNMFHGRIGDDTVGASNLLHREMFSRALATGVRILHTGGAALPGETDGRLLGITHFKEKMGFSVRPAFRAWRRDRPVAALLRHGALHAWSTGRRV
jgi:hypothetical protein